MGTAFSPAYTGASHAYAGIAAKFLTRVKTEARCYDGYLDYLLQRFDQKTLDKYPYTAVTIGANVHLCYWSVDRSIGIRLYSTVILSFHEDQTFWAYDGGFKTPTTRSRISQFGPHAYHFYFADHVLRGADWRTGIGGPMDPQNRYPVFPTLPIKRFGRRTRRVRVLR